LSEADRRKNEFLATLAHELRNPLAPIRNGLQLMHLAGDDPQIIKESLPLMERQVKHMVRLIDDLMDVSRITLGTLELRKERVELASVIRNAVETSRPLIEESRHGLAVTTSSMPIYVDADITRLAQVFSNLLNNAAKYTEPGGEIALIVERNDNEAVVSMQDNGIGIPPEMLEKVFEPFTQVDRSLEWSKSGLGIDLTLVKCLVEMHGGSIEARSGGQRMDSEFVVRLPIMLAMASEAVVGDVSPTMQSAGRRILVVDDNRDSAQTLARLLEIIGHEARTAHDGGEAVAMAEAYHSM
jgi:signal transduction histidine kinase